MIKLKNVLNEEIKKSEMDALGKEVNKAVKLIHKAQGILDSAAHTVRRLEDKDDTDFNDTKSVSRGLYNLRSSLQDGMSYMLRDPLRKSGDILTMIINIGRKVGKNQ